MRALITYAAVLVMMTPIPACAAHPGPELTYYVNAYADHYGVPRALFKAIIEQESGWNSYALSGKGAVGLMQLMPGTAQMYGVHNRYSRNENLNGGAQYLADLLREFPGELRLVVAAYYCGSRPLERRGLSYRNPQVVAYVEAVRRRYERYLREEQLHRTSLPTGGQ